MTLKEAVGITPSNVDVITGEILTHEEVYSRFINYLGGLDEVAEYIPFQIDFLREMLKEDIWMNNTDMDLWDRASGFVCRGADCILIGGGLWNLYRKHGINTASCATGVCILKETARRIIQREDDTNVPS